MPADARDPITPERWSRMAATFDDAMAVNEEDRARFLDVACDGDHGLRRDIEQLLRAAAAPDAFYDASALDRFDALIADVPPQGHGRADDVDLVGQQIGAFRLVRELGRGGMGVVYLAERADEQFTQRVALKLIKRGMDSDFVLRRFRAERQILASLSHPHIARLMDGGTTGDGRPYFVMEFIEGERIDRYVQHSALTLPERLRLFLQLCDAVTYAHQQLVVHRDIKPANILVAKDGSATLLDFGIASLLDDEAPGSTATGVRALTPEYASPEQAAGARASTATDVYSLGVVLYELLTGVLPNTFASRAPADIAARLREADPAAPSSAAEATDLPWRRRLRGDLDTIVMTALRREPEYRYASVEAFATDVRRHLDGVPVQARATSVGYRVGKFVRRNRTLVVGATALVLTMLAGSVATAWQARVATRQADRAERRFNDLRALAHAVLFDYHDAVVNLPGSTPVRARLVKDGLEYLDKLSAEASDDHSLQLELAQAYRRMADVQGGSMRNNLGNSPGALASYRKSQAVLERLYASDSTNADVRITMSDVLSELGVVLWETGDLPAARTSMERANTLMLTRGADAARDTTLALTLNHRHDYLGQVMFAMGNSAEARQEYAAAVQSLDVLPPALKSNARVRRSFSVTYQHLSELFTDAGTLDSALVTARRALALRQTLASQEPLNAELQRALAVSYYYEGEVLARLTRYREARASYRRDLEMTNALRKADPGNALYRGDAEYALVRIGDMAARAGDVPGAIVAYSNSYTMHVEDVAHDSTNLWKRASMIEAQAKIAESQASLHRTAVALPLLAATERVMSSTVVDSTDAAIRSFFAETYTGLGQAYLDLRSAAAGQSRTVCEGASRNFARASELLADMITRRQASHTDSARVANVLAGRAVLRSACPG